MSGIKNIPSRINYSASDASTTNTATSPYRMSSLGLTGTLYTNNFISSGTVSVGGQRIQNVGAPTSNTDAATKLYVDVAAGGVTGILNVQNFGAKGDGVTDDTASFVSALAAATAGQIVAVPPTSTGYYLNTLVNGGAGILIPVGVTLRGYQPGSRIGSTNVSNSSRGPASTITVTTSYPNTQVFQMSTNSTIEGLQVIVTDVNINSSSIPTPPTFITVSKSGCTVQDIQCHLIKTVVNVSNIQDAGQVLIKNITGYPIGGGITITNVNPGRVTLDNINFTPNCVHLFPVGSLYPAIQASSNAIGILITPNNSSNTGITNMGKVTMNNIYFHGYHTGIKFVAPSTVPSNFSCSVTHCTMELVENCIVVDCGISGNGLQIANATLFPRKSTSGSSTTGYGVNISNNATSPSFDAAPTVLISNTTIYNPNGYYRGIYVQPGCNANVVVSNSTIRHCTDYAVNVESSTAFLRLVGVLVPSGTNRLTFAAGANVEDHATSTQVKSVDSNGNLQIFSTTAASSITSASLYTAGGLAISKNLILGQTLSIGSNAGTLAITSGSGLLVSTSGVTMNTSLTGTTSTVLSAYQLSAPTLTATSSMTYTTAGTLEITGPPVASTNVQITNPYALIINSGDIKVGSKPIRYLQDDIIKQGTFSSNLTSDEVDDLTFTNSYMAEVFIHVLLNTGTQTIYEGFKLILFKDAAGVWYVASHENYAITTASTNVTFTVSNGQLSYSTTSLVSSLVMKYRALLTLNSTT